MNRVSVLSLLAACGLGIAGPAAAQSFPTVTPVGACNGALPSYDMTLRKRPLAILNEGTAPAFLSCALAADYGGAPINTVILAFVNRGSADAIVSCTYVDALDPEIGGLLPVYRSASTTVPAGTSSELLWQPEGEDEMFGPVISVSCMLPPQIEIGALGYQPAVPTSARTRAPSW